ncbi:MAG: LysM domain-containing protein [Desulfobacteraceae bacterium]|jgi:LysM repeat protein
MLSKLRRKTAKKENTQTLVCLLVFCLLGGLFCPLADSSENASKIDNLAEIDSGFFVSKDDVYGVQDQAFKEKLLLFVTEKGILTKSSKGLIYYHLSEDAIAKIEDPEFKERIRAFISDSEEKKTSSQRALHRVHQVEPGETLWNIAKRYGMSVEEIVRLNKLDPSETIYPGQKLLVSPDWD